MILFYSTSPSTTGFIERASPWTEPGSEDLIVEPMQDEDFTVEDLDIAVNQLEPLLKLVYDSAKADSKWKGQMAYHQLAPHKRLRKTLLTTACDSPDDRHTLVEGLLRYTQEPDMGYMGLSEGPKGSQFFPIKLP